MGSTKALAMSRQSRWSSTPSVISSRHASGSLSSFTRGTISVGEPRPVDLIQPFPRTNCPSRFDPAPVRQAPPPQPAQSNTGIASYSHQPVPAQAPHTNSPPQNNRPSIGGSVASVDLIRNQGGAEEREQWKTQLEGQAQSRSKDFEARLSKLSSAASTPPSANPYAGGNQHDYHVKDRLGSLKMRFDSALRN